MFETDLERLIPLVEQDDARPPKGDWNKWETSGFDAGADIGSLAVK
jgi:hypothetical protein